MTCIRKKYQINMNREYDEWVISCSKCGLHFVIKGVLFDENYGTIEVMDQGGVYFCPYCGEKGD